MSKAKFQLGDIVEGVRVSDKNPKIIGIKGKIIRVEEADFGHPRYYDVKFDKNVDGWGQGFKCWTCIGRDIGLVKAAPRPKPKWKKAW